MTTTWSVTRSMNGEVVLDDDHGGTGFHKPQHRGRHALPEHRVHPTPGFVKDHEAGSAMRIRQLNEPLLAAAEVSGALVAELEEAELVENLARAASSSLSCRSAVADPRIERQKRSRRESKRASRTFSRTVSAGHSEGSGRSG